LPDEGLTAARDKIDTATVLYEQMSTLSCDQVKAKYISRASKIMVESLPFCSGYKPAISSHRTASHTKNSYRYRIEVFII